MTDGFADAPRIVAGRRVRPVTVEVAPGLRVSVLEAADADEQLAATLRDGTDLYAGILWPTAVAAARALAARVAAGERVLDLGAGTGLSALAAARRGAHAVALDHDPFALELVSAAAALQGLALEARRFDLAGDEPLPPADTVVLADVLYEPALARAAAGRVAEALARGARALVGDPGRLARAEFVAALRAEGLDVAFEEMTVELPGDPLPATVGLAWIGG